MEDYRPRTIRPTMTLREVAEGAAAMLAIVGILYLILSFSHSLIR
jgi:hypothetical protein